ncbi:MAG: hypothetical protein EAZ36_01120 [Verrucomicrobia bacterium]|nr:MAG: hypothetical protein EAZ36_01120 [Verrucomicrobiota bacterium]
MITRFLRLASAPRRFRFILTVAAIALGLHLAGLYVLALTGGLDLFLASGTSIGILCLATVFYGLRLFVFVVLPSWLAVSLWLRATRPPHAHLD